MKYQYLVFILMLYGALDSVETLHAADKLPFQIVVHAENPHDSLKVQDLKKYFLKKKKKWSKFDHKVEPVDLPEKNTVRKAFSKKILRQNVSSIITYWQKQTFGARGSAPKKVSSDRKVMKYVAQSPGAIGYISASTEISEPNIKPLAVKLKKDESSDLDW